ncbi:S24 family peptidase [Mannheimia sp. AT1]|uniref:S24 family peptidase n=1 Tax=Mannheimia cairinae TaxID=3025936 RepID=A0ABT5MQL0_9PAST|nr:S24 family peptidase [Mannheimia cairinae]MDD0824345.1 S24 family peptidase [Mannheimia cairinae]MDD0826532.1 S24 family peptidase [Mannheimia cairinae]
MAKPNIYDQEFSKRMQSLISQYGGNVSAFAQKLEVSPPTVTRWIKGEADPSRTNLIKISEVLNVNLEWLATGKGNQSKATQSIAEKAFERMEKAENEMISMIDSFFSINVSAGFGSFNEGVTQPDGQEPYSSELLQKLGVQAEYCGVFWAGGRSMHPTIADGDQMLVSFKHKEVRGNNIYLVQNGDSVWVKRVKVLWDGVELISDNKEEYEPIKITTDEAQNLQIIGQVVHNGHSLV